MDDRLLVLNRDADCVSVFDPASGDPLHEIETDFDPCEIETSPDGSKSYVTCASGDCLNIIDNETFQITGQIDHELFDRPNGLVVRERANELWLVSEKNSQLFVFDIETDALLDVIETHQDRSHMLALNADESRLYVANSSGKTLTVIDCDERRVSVDVPVGNGPKGVGVNPETDNVYIAVRDESKILILDPKQLEVAYRTELGTTPTRVEFSPQQTLALVPNQSSNDVSVIETRFPRNGTLRPWEVQRIPVGIRPGGVVFNGDGSMAYVANTKSNDVSVLDMTERREQFRIDTHTHPNGITYVTR